MDSQTVWNTFLHTFIKSSSCSWPRAAKRTPSPAEAVYVAAAGGRHSSLKRRLKRVHKLFMAVIIWHQPACELREVQEHLLRGLQHEDGRGPSSSINPAGGEAGWLQQEATHLMSLLENFKFSPSLILLSPGSHGVSVAEEGWKKDFWRTGGQEVGAIDPNMRHNLLSGHVTELLCCIVTFYIFVE